MKRLLAFIAVLLLAVGLGTTPPASAQVDDRGGHDYGYYDYYDYYEPGWDEDTRDDWYFDQYSWDPAAYDGTYHVPDGYDYDADRFDWEERGLFE